MQNSKTIRNYLLNCFTIEPPLICQVYNSILTIADSHNQIYKIKLDQEQCLNSYQTLSIKKTSKIRKCSSFVSEEKDCTLILFEEGKIELLKGGYEEKCIEDVVDYQIFEQNNQVEVKYVKKLEENNFQIEELFSGSTGKIFASNKPNTLRILSQSIIVHGNVVEEKNKKMSIDFLHQDFDSILTTNLNFTICKSTNNHFYIYENEDKWQQLDVGVNIVHAEIFQKNGINIISAINQVQGKTQILIYVRKEQGQENFIKITHLPFNMEFPQIIPEINNSNMILLDKSSMNIFYIEMKLLVEQGGKMKEDEGSLHENIQNTLNYRKKCLKMLRKYLQQNDSGSALRYLDCCENASVLNDGLVMLGNFFKQKYLEDIFMNIKSGEKLIQLCVKMLESKYESHIQNSLILLINIFEALNHSQNVKKQLRNKLKEIGNGKRMKKLTQQTKKKKIFQLAYQYVNMVNSSHLYR